jgi:hypothetical protein
VGVAQILQDQLYDWWHVRYQRPYYAVAYLAWLSARSSATPDLVAQALAVLVAILELIAGKRGPTRLGFALLLTTRPQAISAGWSPRHLDQITGRQRHLGRGPGRTGRLVTQQPA